MKTKTYTVKVIEDAVKIASKEFGISEDELAEKIISENAEEETNEVEVTVCIDPIEKAKRYIQMIFDENKVDGKIEKRVRDNVVEYDIYCEDFNGVLIGKNSRHLLALQTLLSLVINRYYAEDEQVIVKVDVGGYRRRKESHIERMAVDYAKQVAETKQAIRLDGLNSYERKIIHDRLTSWKDVITHSEGERPDRVLFIEPAKPEKKEKEVVTEETKEIVTEETEK
ncbi:MAG: R3H domain-containing nucleic acid-binding protein [Bacilli bacterium]